ncbi:MAG: hypothetical protein UV61_C0004G0049 [Candidatus Gottesmanbacteria bacterium GW2011_GWB1_43_11]|uniref:Gluconeogenesis factor n=1 Tax=Candidatus Gottesmanbacteria bacterium GW2011_GWB1_43_11 TaxID=1618446 RepID=A0A0G1FJU3_9BACT|nr:MAG: hypothetical protein UV04_C0007G0050 [Candidatus Gottesmanbacteria bacterium GW2011_GWA2_42_16]KKS55632.1 MAG: hypothetical protein UV17_C0009G0013 [Candidatus Gottesmanbacteria bacterium GW2011_GWA1_42_26]KKS82225.1 MAG: hypothetical protein UV55_C0004G0041 [Candidatus Gottesmanbacteria bacterium GW2011_GWC1_43_10]KKS87123.1 MAG: hypothetical protein UV61_C0004G0049 [Candidatus Gottesmanbacteria bacterium GW2011_GWB1_43_11]OGG07617.1 MAG: hypothetical protein A2699_02190 [Candidatus Go
MPKEAKIVCLGGGVGTVQLLRGLRKYTHNITVVVSMADDGGSAGRLRRLYSVPPPGDLINCLAALSNAEPRLAKLLTFRFKGGRWGRDDSLGGQKLGNLILVAMTQLTRDFKTALVEMQRIFRSHGVIFPATNENVSIWAETVEGKVVKGEINIDLGRYSGKREIREVHLEPKLNTTPTEVKQAILEADAIIAGPGDLYTTILPILLVKDIRELLKKAAAKTFFIVNIANKPFETPRYTVADYLEAVTRHLGSYPFKYTLINRNQTPTLPPKFHYSYVPVEADQLKTYNTKIVTGDLVDESFPLYHNPDKVARKIIEML